MSNKVSKLVHDLINYVSDYTVQGVVSAKVNGELNIDDVQLERIVVLIKQLIEAGYHRSIQTLIRSL